MQILRNVGRQGSEGEDSEGTDDPDDPEYQKDTQSEDSEDSSVVLDDIVSDEEFQNIRQNAKRFKGDMYNSMNVPNRCVSEDFDCENETLRSLSSSSEDENA